jgi:hypothetical protein
MWSSAVRLGTVSELWSVFIATDSYGERSYEEWISVKSDRRECRIAFMLWLRVIKNGCNKRANKIQSPELEPVISSRVPPYTSQYRIILTNFAFY